MNVKEILGFNDHDWFELVADLGIDFAERNTPNTKNSRELCAKKSYWAYITKRINKFSESWMDCNLGENRTYKSKKSLVRGLFVKLLKQHFNTLRTKKQFKEVKLAYETK